MTLEVLGGAIRGGKGWRFGNPLDDVRSFIRVEAVQDVDFAVLRDPDAALLKRYAKKLEALKGYEASDGIEKSRAFDFLDESRHPQYIDDVLVFLEKEGLQPEGCWARIVDVSERRIWAKLLNEPEQDFGIHEGEDFTFYVHKDEESGKITCHAQFSPLRRMKPEDFEDGTLMKDAIHRYKEGNTGDALFELFQILRDSFVWIPCTAVVGEEDQQQVLQMIGEAGDDQYFLPVFSTEEDMGEYGEPFSKLQEHFLQVIELARNNKNIEDGLTGIVINAFTEPFVLPKELYEAVEKMVSRVEQD